MKNIFENRNTFNVLLLCIFVLITGTFKIYNPSEIYWDFVNYHYYNAWAFFHHRLGYDIAPAQINTYFNPLLDIPYYLMLNAWQNTPSVIHFFQGMWYGILCFVVCKICFLFFDLKKETLASICACLIAMTGYSALSQMGVCSNEVQVSTLILLGFYLICKHIPDVQRKKSVWLWSGLIMGFALGLKPTVICYCLAMGGILIVFSKPLHISYKEIIVFALSGMIGYLLANGWWMWQLYSHFDNPFFPFLNKIFQSDYYEVYNFRDEHYLNSTTLLEKLYLPILISFGSLKNNYVSEGYFFDVRYALTYCILIGMFLKWLLTDRKISSLRNTLLYVFLVTSFIIWAGVFSIIRYAIPIEMLTAIVIVKFFQKINPKGMLSFCLLTSFYIIGFYALVSEVPNYLKIWRIGNEGFVKLFEPLERQINVPDDALVQTYGYPSAMIAARIIGEKPNRILNYANGHTGHNIDFVETHKFSRLRDSIVRQHQGPVIAIIASNYFSRTSIEAEFFASLARKRQAILESEGMYCRLFLLTDKIIVCTPEEYKEQVFVKDKK